jgi:hypothetical protein
MNRVIITYSSNYGLTIEKIVRIGSIFDEFNNLPHITSSSLSENDKRILFLEWVKSFGRCSFEQFNKDKLTTNSHFAKKHTLDMLWQLEPLLGKEMFIAFENYAMYPPDLDCDEEERAKRIAHWAHKNQTRWDGTPYACHPEAVANALQGKARIVGWLHDVIEDTRVTLQDLRNAGFSFEIADGVDSVTKRPGESYLDAILRAKKNPLGIKVKIADLKHNISSLNGPATKDKKNAYTMALYILESHQKTYKFFGNPVAQGPDHIHEDD